jgi:subtilisin family serine protease
MVAGIAGGENVGVAPQSTLIAIQVLGSDGSGLNSDVIAGLKSVLDQHTKSKNKNSIVNMSLGSEFSQAVNDMVKSLTDAGVHVVVAAGNNGADACLISPASAKTAVTVGALDNTGNKDIVASFSSIGECLDIFAPGVDIESAKAGTTKDLIRGSGTSFAAPHVSGTIALIISKDRNMAPAKMVKELLTLSTKGLLSHAQLKMSPNKILRVPAP